MQKQKVKVGVVGCGGICKATYMNNMVNKFEIIDVVGAADQIDSRAQWMADHYGIKKMTVEEMMNDPEIEAVSYTHLVVLGSLLCFIIYKALSRSTAANSKKFDPRGSR